jgi:hypothetical protein
MFEIHKLKHMARIYSEQLPTRLKRDYGTREFYTEPQVRAAVFHLDLDATYIFLAYAMYLTKPEYDELLPRLPLYLTYEHAREFFIEYEPEDIRSEEFGPNRGWTGFRRTM